MPVLLPASCVCVCVVSPLLLSMPLKLPARGGFLFVRHNEIRDSIANLLKEIYHVSRASAFDW